MKRTEFVNELLLEGFLVDVGRYDIIVTNRYGDRLFEVSESKRYRLNNFFKPFGELDGDKQEMLFYLGAHYASTPINER